MVNSDFHQFLETLAGDENSLDISQRAIACLAGILRIGQIDLAFQVGDTPGTPGGEERNAVLFVADGFTPDDRAESAAYHKAYQTGEHGTAAFTVLLANGAAPWDDAERMQLDDMLDVLFFHAGRSRLIGLIRSSRMCNYLTGLPNAGGFTELVGRKIAAGEASAYNASYSNLKGFSLINRRFGQQEGDRIIKRYAASLSQFFQPDEILGHLGGDNFVAIIRKERTEDFLALLAGVDAYGMLGERRIDLKIAATTGVWEIDDTLKEPGQVLGQTALALNAAKNVLKKPYVFVTEELNRKAFTQKQALMRFQSAIQGHEFHPHYQPKVDAATGELVGAEALVRWTRDGKMVSPMDFVPVIELDGAIHALDCYMLRCVCSDIRAWLDQGLKVVPISVNFSRRDLSDPDLAELIDSMIEEYHLDRKLIEVEITETTDEEETGLMSSFVKKLQSKGISTAIDDFGTGYSSLNVLRMFQVSVLKLDKSLIDAVISERDAVVLKKVIEMAQLLDVNVLAEGVENWTQLEEIRDLGCHIIQGYVFDRPLPTEEFTERLKMRFYDLEEVKRRSS